MADERLVGYWSDKDLYLGGMEATDIAFRADGTGWTNWSNAAGAFEIVRFRWQAASDAALVLHLREPVSGTWNLDGGTVTHQQRDREPLNEQLSLSYEIAEGQNAVSNPATVLRFDRHVIDGIGSNQFAFERRLAASERDPV